MKIALDVMGFENDISHAIKAARHFTSEHPETKIILVGDEKQIRTVMPGDEFEIVHTDQFVAQDDTILTSRRKPKSSMQICATMLRDGVVDGLVSAGSTPIFVFTMYQTIGLLDGIKKPGFMPTFPTLDSVGFNMIDVGASTDVTPLDLALFGIMANEYASHRLTDKPRVGLLNIGTEAHKGTNLQRDAAEILQKVDGLNYIGFVEPNFLLERSCDVVVTDGYTGNIALKAMEGTARSFGKALKTEFMKHPVAGLLSKKVFRAVKEKLNYKNYAGAFVLGLKQIVVKTHGSADEKQFYSALQMLYSCLKADVLTKIKAAIDNFFLVYPEYQRS